MKLDLPLKDYILGGKMKLSMWMYPEWVDKDNLDEFTGYVYHNTYEADIVKNCNPKPGGCPYLYVQDSTNTFVVDNNILHRSEFQ